MNILWGNRYIHTGAQTRFFALGAAFNQNAITGRARSQARITKSVASLREIHVSMTPRSTNAGANGEKVFFGLECERPDGQWERLGEELEWITDGVTKTRSLTGLNASCPAGSQVVAYARTETSIGVSPTYMHITGVFR